MLQHLVLSLSISSYSVHRFRADSINKLCIKLVIETILRVMTVQPVDSVCHMRQLKCGTSWKHVRDKMQIQKPTSI